MAGLLHEFGPFCFDTRQLLLLRDLIPIVLGRRGAVIFATLLAMRCQIVGKEALLDAAWPGISIEESNLSVQVSKLRRIIGETHIRTVERVGYQFLSEPAVFQPLHPSSPDTFPSIAITATEPQTMKAVVFHRLCQPVALQICAGDCRFGQT